MSQYIDELFDPENLFNGLSYEEFCLQQENMHQSIQEHETNEHVVDAEEQEAIDEALARSLQELGDGFDDLILSEYSRGASGSRQPHATTPSREQGESSNTIQDSVDVDNMGYEELGELSEAIGRAKIGLSAKSIRNLPRNTYKTGILNPSDKKDEICVICQIEYNHGEARIQLPCLDKYHEECITKWLLGNKLCPLCKKEVVPPTSKNGCNCM